MLIKLIGCLNMLKVTVAFRQYKIEERHLHCNLPSKDKFPLARLHYFISFIGCG